MRLVVLTALSALALSGCAAVALEGAAAEAALGGLRLGMAEGAAAGLAEGAALRASTGLLVDSSLAGEVGGGTLAEALTDLGAGRASLVVDSTGLIRSGSQRLAMLEGSEIRVNNHVAGVLREGRLYEIGAAEPIGTLRGVVPGAGAELQLVDGSVVQTTRSMLVDVLQLSNGRFLIRLPSGALAWTSAVATLALMGGIVASDCSQVYDDGAVIRNSGETVQFNDCNDADGVLVLGTPHGQIVLDSSEVAGVISGPTASLIARQAGG